MKIPDKKIVNIQINEAKRRQIDEGVIIAKKIDILRAELSSLENRRREFIEGNKKVLEKELSELSEKKNVLLRKIHEYESKYKGMTEIEVKEQKDIERGIFLENREKEAQKRFDRLTLLSEEIISNMRK